MDENMKLPERKSIPTVTRIPVGSDLTMEEIKQDVWKRMGWNECLNEFEKLNKKMKNTFRDSILILMFFYIFLLTVVFILTR